MKKTITVNLNFDDFHPQLGRFGDFGGDPHSGTFKKLTDLCERFPGLVITLFTTPNWTDRPYRTHRYWYLLRELLGLRPVVVPEKDEPFLLAKHRSWCTAVRERVASGQFEIAVHGYMHTNPESRIHGQEFVGISRELTEQKIRAAENAFKDANIPFVKAFRPPGWGENASLSAVLKGNGYEIFARDSSRAKTNVAGEYEQMVTPPQNWSIRESKEEALRLAEETGAVYMKGHLVYQYGTEIIENGITDDFWSTLESTLEALTEQYDVRFVSFSDFATRQT